MTNLWISRPDADANTLLEKLWGGGIVQWAGLLHWAGILQGPRGGGQQTGTKSWETKVKRLNPPHQKKNQLTGVRWFPTVIRCHHQSCYWQSPLHNKLVTEPLIDLDVSSSHCANVDRHRGVCICDTQLLFFQSWVTWCTSSLCSRPQILLFSLVSSQRQT